MQKNGGTRSSNDVIYSLSLSKLKSTIMINEYRESRKRLGNLKQGLVMLIPFYQNVIGCICKLIHVLL